MNLIPKFFILIVFVLLYSGAGFSQVKANAEPEWKKPPIDSITFTGRVNSKQFLYVTGTNHCLHTVFVNGAPAEQMYVDTIKVDFAMFGLKKGSLARVKAIYLKSGKVKLLPGGALDVK